MFWGKWFGTEVADNCTFYGSQSAAVGEAIEVLAFGYGLNETVAFAWVVQTAYSKTYGH